MTNAFKQRQGRGLRKPNVVTTDMEFAARNVGRMDEETEGIDGENQGATSGGVMTHRRPGTALMFKPVFAGDQRTIVSYAPRTIPVTAIAQNLENGWTSTCPDCNSVHGADPNECEGRPAVAVVVCPVCRKRIYDNGVNLETTEASDDPNVINLGFPDSTPESRLRVRYAEHAWTFHPRTARQQNLAALPKQDDNLPLVPPEVLAAQKAQ